MRRLSDYGYGKSGAWTFFALLSLAACVNVAAAQGPVPARLPEQSNAGEPAAYRLVVDDAKREYDLGNFAEARALFAKAIALYPNAKALRGKGMTEFELRNYGDCMASLEQALVSSVKPLDGELRAETERLLERARSFVARLEIAVDPGAAVVLVDGVPIQLGPQRTLVLESGAHTFEFRADGYAPEKLVKKFIGGEQETVRIVLPRDESGKAAGPVRFGPPDPPLPHHDDRKPLYKNPWLWGGVAAVAVIATGVAIGVSRRGGGGTEDPPVGNPFDSKRAD
ncbi:MAG: hypothetical protein RLZZ450_392 [Pseudomonadota bacterium]|jgi:hypothetical protein